MSDTDVKSIQRLGVIVIVALLLNFWMIHRKEDAIREFGMYFQGVMTGTSLQAAPSKPHPPSPIIQTFYEN